MVDVPLRVVDPTCLRGFDIAVVPDKATYHWLRYQGVESSLRLLHGDPSELSSAIAHAAALCGFERRLTAADNRPSIVLSHSPAALHGGNLPRHVLLLLDRWRSGGLERVVLTLARALSGRGVRTTVGLASEAEAPPSLIEELSARSTAGVPAEIVTFAGDEAALSRFLHVEAVSHANLHHTIFGLGSLRRACVASIYTFHNSYVWFDTAQRERWRQALRMADLCIAVSRQVASFAAGAFVVPPHALRIVPNGVDVGAGAGSYEASRDAHSQEFRFVNVASFNRVKMQHALLDSFAAMAARRPQARLTLLGTPDDTDFFEEVLASRRALGLEDRVEVIPGENHASTLRRVATADCFVMPSAIEGWSLALTEATALGVPCVATDVGAAEDLRQRGAALRLVPPLASEPDHLPAAALRALLSHPPRRFVEGLTDAMEAVMSDAAELRAKAGSAAGDLRETFSVARMTEEYLEAFALARVMSGPLSKSTTAVRSLPL